MSTPEPLDDVGIERLADALDARAVPFKGFNLEALDGFLSALAVGPASVPQDEWMPVVWGGKSPTWDSLDETREMETLLSSHWALAEQRVRYADDELPDRLSPLLWMPEDPGAHDDDELDVGRDWAYGFFRGVELCEAAWESWLEAHDWIEHSFELLDRLFSGTVTGEDPSAEPETLSYTERLAIIVEIPGMLSDLHHHRIEMLTPRTPIRREATPERNDPCPCGSGKKYKKCHGA